MNYLNITCRDPIVARDGRPFNEGGKIRILPWVLPSVVAGSFRTLLGKKIDPTFKGELPDQLKQVSVHGFFPHYENQIYLPKPDDCIAKPTNSNSSELLAVIPQKLESNQGCDLPLGNLLPVMLSGTQSQDDFKPASLPEWWPVSAIEKWLTNQPVSLNESFLNKPETDQRTHLTVNEDCIEGQRGRLQVHCGRVSLGLATGHSATGRSTTPAKRHGASCPSVIPRIHHLLGRGTPYCPGNRE